LCFISINGRLNSFIGEFSNDPTEIAAAYASQRKIPLEEATELLAKFPDVVKGQLSNPEASTSTRVSQGLTSGATLPLRGAFAAGSSLSDLMKGKSFAESGENAVQGMSSTEGFKGGVQNDPVVLASMALPMVGAAKAAQIATKLPKFISPTAVRAASGAVGQGGLAGTRQIMRDVNEQPVEGSPMGDILTSAAIGGTVPVAGEYLSKMLKEGASNRAFNNPNLSDLVGWTGKGTEQRLLNKQSDISKNLKVPEDVVDFDTYNNLLINAKTPKLRSDAEQFLKSDLINNLTLENEKARRAGMSFENFNVWIFLFECVSLNH